MPRALSHLRICDFAGQAAGLGWGRPALRGGEG